MKQNDAYRKHQEAYAQAIKEAHELYDAASVETLEASLRSIRELIRRTYSSHKLVAAAEVISARLQDLGR